MLLVAMRPPIYHSQLIWIDNYPILRLTSCVPIVLTPLSLRLSSHRCRRKSRHQTSRRSVESCV